MHAHIATLSKRQSSNSPRPHCPLLTFPTPAGSSWPTHAAGFTLIEVMIVTAIIAMLVAISAPSLRAYANKSRVAQVTATATAIRTALEAYTIDAEGSYPPQATLATWQNWRDFLSQFSTPLPASSTDAGIRLMTYTSANPDTYNVQIEVNVPNGVVGKTIVLTPEGLSKN